jgi:hypothetical protein
MIGMFGNLLYDKLQTTKLSKPGDRDIEMFHIYRGRIKEKVKLSL